MPPAAATTDPPSTDGHQASGFGRDACPELWSKAAALLQSVVKDHAALVDGNKRLGWLATAAFLELNGITVTRVSNAPVYRS